MKDQNLQNMEHHALWRSSRPVFHNPEKPTGGSESAETPAQREKIGKLLNDYERRRANLLSVIEDFKKKEDPELRLKATQYENRVLNETVDPSVLRSLRGLGENDIKKYIDKLVDIANSTIERDERLGAWLESREREKVDEMVERYNYMRQVNIELVTGLKRFFGSQILFDSIMDKLTNDFPKLAPEDVKDRRGIQGVIVELASAMEKLKPQIDAARAQRHKQYETAFYHAVGRVHDRFLTSLENDPAEFERRVAEMVNRITEVDLKEAEAGDKWTVTYEGLTFSINRGGAGMYAKLTGASDANLSRYAKLGEFLEKPRRGQKKTADVRPPTGRKIETDL
jgi:hypothetical protein